jgi:outer membrane immunogenic protein
MIMRRFYCAVLAAAAVIGFASVASAADLPTKAPVYTAPPVVAYNWSGVYAGVSIGWEHNNADYILTNPIPATIPPASMSSDEAVFGGHLGVQYQWNNVVLGIEAAGVGNFGSVYASKNNCYATAVGGTCQVHTDALTTVGGRLGWAWNDWMVYGTGGWARANVSSNFIQNSGFVFDNTQNHQSGWYVGGGVDYLLVKGPYADLITGLEYQHVDLGTAYHASSADGFGPSPPGANGRNISVTEDIVRVRLTVKINPFR